MKLQINSARDPRAISPLPPRPRSSGGIGRTSAPVSSEASVAGYGHWAQALQTFSRGVGGGDASLLHPKQSRLPEASAGESLSGGLHLPTPASQQGISSHDGLSNRMPPFPPSSASHAREGSQQQLAIVPNNTSHSWNTYHVDSRCQLNEDAEHRFQQLASSVHKVGIVLDLVQNDAIRLNRAMKEALLDSGGIQKKADLLENSLQQIIKGQNGLRVLHEGSTVYNRDYLGVLNSHTSKLNEISSTLLVWPEQVRADLRQLHGDIFSIFTKKMEGVTRAIRSINSKSVAMQMLELNDQSFSSNERLKMDQTPGTNGILQMDRTPVANRRPYMEQIPETKLLPAHSIYSTRVEDWKPNVKQENVKGSHLVCSSYVLAPKRKEASNQKVNTQEPTKKVPVSIIIGSDDDHGRISSVNLNTEPAQKKCKGKETNHPLLCIYGTADLMKEASGQEGPLLPRWTRRKRKRTEMIRLDATTLLTGVTGGGEKRRQEAEPKVEKGEAVHVAAAPAKRARRPNPKYDTAQWAT